MFVRSERRLSDNTDFGSRRQISFDKLSATEEGVSGGRASWAKSLSTLWSNWGMIPKTGTLRNSSTPSMVPMDVSNDSRPNASTIPRNTPINDPIIRFNVVFDALIGFEGVMAGAIRVT